MNKSVYRLSQAEKDVFEHIPTYLAVFQILQGHFYLLTFSDGLCRFLESDRSTIMTLYQENKLSLLHPDDFQKAQEQAAQSCLYPNIPYKGLFRIRNLSTMEYHWMRCQGMTSKLPDKTLLMYMQYEDVTFGHEKTFFASSYVNTGILFDKILSTTKTAIFWKDIDRRFLGANKAFLDYYDFPSVEAVLGKTDEDMGWHEDPEPYKNDELRILEEGISTYRVPGNCISHGEKRNIVASKSPIYENGKIIGLVGSFEDVTVETRQKEEISNLNEQLKAALQNEEKANHAKSDFLTRISHEIRTPLNAIIGLTTIQRQSEYSRQQIDNYLSKVESASRFLLSIINDVLDMSAIEQGKLSISCFCFDIKTVINNISTIYYSQCQEKGIDFSMKVNLSNELLIGDSLRINQILMNLVSNAFKFTDSGGSISINVSESAHRNHTVFVKFEVADTGAGMDPEMLNRLFHPFEQESANTFRKYGGSGLGLSITKNLIDMMHGSIAVHSQKGKGSVFTVELPFETIQQSKSEQNYATCLQQLHVLVVDDEQSGAEYTGALLKRLQVPYELASSGQKALQMIDERQAEDCPYDVILLDCQMPGLDGLEVARQIRRDYGEKAIIIIVSAYDVSQIEEEAKAAGVDRLISKPLFQSTLFNLFVSLSHEFSPFKENCHSDYNFQGHRILIAEDNEINQEVVKGLLHFVNMETDFASDGQEALNKFSSSAPGTYDAILMDIQMPIMDGHQTTRAIRLLSHPQAKDIPILAMTADAFTEDISAAFACGMNGHIAKPIDQKELYRKLDQAIRHLKIS